MDPEAATDVDTFRTRSAADLGPLRSTHAPTAFDPRQKVAAIMTVIGGALVCLVMLVAGGGKSALLPVPIIVLAAAVWVAETAKQWWRRGDRLDLHEQGILLSQRGVVRTLAWDEITAVVSKRSELAGRGRAPGHDASGGLAPIEKAGRWTHVLRAEGVPPLTLTEGWSDVGAIVARLQEVRRERFLPRCRERYEAGQPVAFGPLVVAADGIHHRDRVLAWEEFVSARQEQGAIVVKRKPNGRFASQDVADVPDLHVFLLLVEWAKKRHAKQDQST